MSVNFAFQLDLIEFEGYNIQGLNKDINVNANAIVINFACQQCLIEFKGYHIQGFR